jgi:hypothetical protein
VADHLSRMNRGQDDKEPIEDKIRDDMSHPEISNFRM